MHIDNKVRWCLKKAEKEKKKGKHRGLLKTEPNLELAKKHITKAEHNLKAIVGFHRTGFSDWSASASFYTIYHALLAIITKLGYESKNQECTFALIYQLIKNNKKLIKEIHLFDPEEKHEQPTVIELREIEQYGINISMEEKIYNRLLKLAQTILGQAKEIIES